MNTFFRQLSPTEINRETYHVMYSNSILGLGLIWTLGV